MLLRFRFPGADHHARWMSKIIYSFKMVLLKKCYTVLDEKTVKDLEEFALFSAVVYCKHWFESPLAVSAPRNDLELYGKILDYRQQCGGVKGFKLLAKFRNQMWYLTPQLIVLSLFDDGLDDEEREDLAVTLSKVPREKVSTGRGYVTNLTWPGHRPLVSSFLGPDSWLMFDLCGVDGVPGWLNIPCCHWSKFEDYQRMEAFARNMTVTNDAAGMY